MQNQKTVNLNQNIYRISQDLSLKWSPLAFENNTVTIWQWMAWPVIINFLRQIIQQNRFQTKTLHTEDWTPDIFWNKVRKKILKIKKSLIACKASNVTALQPLKVRPHLSSWWVKDWKMNQDMHYSVGWYHKHLQEVTWVVILPHKEG